MDVEKEAAAEQSESSDDEEAMEIDGKPSLQAVAAETPDEGQVSSEKATAAKAKKPPAPAPVAVSCGLPQSQQELESLIRTIQQSVTSSVLPRLQKCLNAKVRFFVLFLFFLIAINGNMEKAAKCVFANL